MIFSALADITAVIQNYGRVYEQLSECTATGEGVSECAATGEGVSECTATGKGMSECTATGEGVSECTATGEGVSECTAIYVSDTSDEEESPGPDGSDGELNLGAS